MLWGEVNLISPPSRLRVSPPQSQDTEGWKSSGGTPDNGVTRLCINFASRRINASLSARIILFKEFPLSCNLRQNYVVIKFCRDQFGQFWVKRLANIFPNLKHNKDHRSEKLRLSNIDQQMYARKLWLPLVQGVKWSN